MSDLIREILGDQNEIVINSLGIPEIKRPGVILPYNRKSGGNRKQRRANAKKKKK